jgi:hypothetical protein
MKTICPYIAGMDCNECKFNEDNHDYGDTFGEDYDAETEDAMRVDYDEKDPW